MSEIVVKDALELAQENYKEYSTYIAQGRAYPSLVEGLKSSYKRAIYGMYLNNNHKITKVAELAGHALPYHPHPTSISGVIVQLGENGNRLKLMKTQGNWGDSTRRIEASADRYIGGYLSPFAEQLLCDSVEYARTVRGELDKEEPQYLPVLLPLCFINGLKGIPSGLPTLNIPTVNIEEMIDYYINVLSHKNVHFQPRKFPSPNYDCEVISKDEDWNQIMRTGKGSIKLAPVMKIDGTTITITQLPQSKTADNVYKIIEKEILADKVDFTNASTKSTLITIEKIPYKQVDMNELYKRLYTKLQVTESFNLAFFDEKYIYVPCGFHNVVKANIEYLIETHTNRIEHEMEDVQQKLSVLEIIERLKHDDSIKSLVNFSTEEAVQFISDKYSTTLEIARKVFQKPLSYLTKEHNQEIVDYKNKLIELTNDKSDIYEFLIKKYKELKKALGKELKEQAQ